MKTALTVGLVAHASSARSVAALTLLFIMALPVVSAPLATDVGVLPIAPMYADASLFDPAVATAAQAPLAESVTGLVVSHHLLAVDLIAAAFTTIRGKRYDKIVIIGPDHYSRGTSLFSVCDRDLNTCFGPVPVAGSDVAQLRGCPLVSPSGLFSHEHAVQALVPFCARILPNTPILAIAIANKSRVEDWNTLYSYLAPLVSSTTLVVQSTDYSHFLTPFDARRHDQDSLQVLAGADERRVASLSQPQHCDCLGAMYLQMRLQRERFGARPWVIDNRNSQEYAPEPIASSTSYIAAVYSPGFPRPGLAPTWAFAGDTFFGRFMVPRLANPHHGPATLRAARDLVGSATLAVNLEGVFANPDDPTRTPIPLAMDPLFAQSWLRALGARVVITANNHGRDFGARRYREMCNTLHDNRFTVVGNLQTVDLGSFTLTALTDLDNNDPRIVQLLSAPAVADLPLPHAGKPAFAFVHWGREWQCTPTPRQREVASWLETQGFTLIIGCHPHVASSFDLLNRANCAWSLGNFLFDQARPPAGGAVLEVAFFRQGTWFARLRPIGNLYTTTTPAH